MSRAAVAEETTAALDREGVIARYFRIIAQVSVNAWYNPDYSLHYLPYVRGTAQMGREISKRAAITPDAVYENDDEARDLMSMEVYDGVPLSYKEIAFVDAYVGEARFSASAAYRIVSGREKDSNRFGPAWLKKPHIIRAVQDRLNTNGLSAEAALQELKDVALAEWRDLVEVKMRNGEVLDAKIDLSPKVRALEIILRAHNMLDNKSMAQAAVVVNINTPGLHEDELA